MESSPQSTGVSSVASPLVGRQREVAALHGAWAETAAGRGTLVLLSGEPGIGKTRLASEVVAHADASGACTAWGQSGDDIGAPAFAPWRQVLRRLLDTASSDIRAGLSPLLELLLAPADASSRDVLHTEDSRFALFDAVVTLLLRRAAQQPLLLALDDLHAADLPSLHLLDLVSRHIRSHRILLIGTLRPVEAQQSTERGALLHRIARQGQTLPIVGLALEAVTSLVRQMAHDTEAERIQRVFERTGGNPFFVTEIARMMANESAHATPAGHAAILDADVPPTVRDMVRQRLQILSPACRELLAVAAVCGREFDLETVRQAMQLERGACLDLVHEADRAMLVTTLASARTMFLFRHMLIRDVVYDDLLPSARVRWHRCLAPILESQHRRGVPVNLSSIAYHYLEALDAGDAKKPLEYALLAAQEADEHLAYEEAATHYERALEVFHLAKIGDPQRRCEILLALGAAQRRGGSSTARETYLQAWQIAQRLDADHINVANELLARAVLGVADQGLGMPPPLGDPLVRGMLDEAIAAIGPGDSGLRAQLMASLAMQWASDNDGVRAIPLSAAAVAMARRVGDRLVLAHTLSFRHYVLWSRQELEGRLDVASELVELGRSLQRPELAVEGRGWQLVDWLIVGDVASFDRYFTDLVAQSERLRQPRFLWLTKNFKVARALLRGAWKEADATLAEAMQLVQESGDPNADGAAYMQRFVLLRERDELADLEPLIRLALQSGAPTPTPRCFLAVLLHDTGRVDEAAEHFAELARSGFEDLRRQHRVGILPFLAELAAHVGRPADIEALQQLLRPWAHLNVAAGAAVTFGAGARYLALLAAAQGDAAAARTHFDEALAANSRMGAAGWLAWTQFDYGDWLARQHSAPDRQRGAELVALAAAAAERLAMSRLIQRLRSCGTVSDPHDSALEGGGYAFRRDGDFWEIGALARPVRLRHTKGLEYIGVLLSEPGRESHALELEHPDSSPLGSTSVASGPALDAQARGAYAARLRELRDELGEAEEFHDLGRIGKLQDEMSFLTRELSRAFGLHGRHRNSGSPAERARLNVTRAIKAVLKRIAAQDPAVGKHLEATIKTGIFCSYRLGDQPAWRWHL